MVPGCPQARRLAVRLRHRRRPRLFARPQVARRRAKRSRPPRTRSRRAPLYRLPLDSFEPRFRIGYVRQVFDADVSATTPLPAVAYNSLRFGLGTSIFLVDWLTVDVNAAYLYVLDAGEIGSNKYAPNLSTNGFEVGLSLGTWIKDVFGIRVGVDFRQVRLRLRHEPGGRVPAAQGRQRPLRAPDAGVRLSHAWRDQGSLNDRVSRHGPFLRFWSHFEAPANASAHLTARLDSCLVRPRGRGAALVQAGRRCRTSWAELAQPGTCSSTPCVESRP